MKNGEKIQSIKKTHPFKIWDLCVYALIIASAVLLLIAASRPKGDTVRISYYDAAGKRVTITRPLDSDDTIIVPVENVNYKIIIGGGKVWAEESGCRDKVCMGMGKISRVNQQIICLPYRIVITIAGESDADFNIK